MSLENKVQVEENKRKYKKIKAQVKRQIKRLVRLEFGYC